MSRADEYLPIPPRTDPEPYAGMEMTEAQRAGVSMEERFVPGPANAPDVRVLIYRPKQPRVSGKLPVLLSIHGGAFVMLRADSFPAMDAGWALDHQCVVVSVDYRLAPEHPFPAGPEDCYAVLEWVAQSAEELGVDLERLVVTGGSAGGALTAAVTLMARDREGPKIAFQGLLIPVTDDRLDTPSQRQMSGSPGFNAEGAIGMWLHYLGEDYDRTKTSPYAAPARAESLAGLPPAFVQVNELDPLRDEGLAYGQRLLAEGISVEMVCVPGAYHGEVPLRPSAAARGHRVYNAALQEALHPDGLSD